MKQIQQIYYIEGYWTDIKNRRNFFIEFARKHKFDPLVADNWYNFNMNSFKGIQRVCYNYVMLFLTNNCRKFPSQKPLYTVHYYNLFQTLD